MSYRPLGTDVARALKMKTTKIIALSLSLFSLAIAQSISDELSLAYTLAKKGRYTDAILKTQPLLDTLKLDTVKSIVLGNKILSVSYCELGERDKAQDTLSTLKAFSPDETFNEFSLSEVCADFFGVPPPQTVERHTDSTLPSLTKPEVELAKTDATAPRIRSADVKSEPPEVSVNSQQLDVQNVPEQFRLPENTSPHWRLFVPFGSGQFFNQEPKKGVAFLSSQIFGIVTAATMFALFKADQNSDGTFSNPGRANIYKTTYWSSLGLAAGSAVWGVLDATILHKKR